MKTPCFTSLLIILLLSPLKQYGQSAISIGDNRELFLDHYLIDKMDGTELVLHHPRCEGPVLYFDRPWEGPFSAYCTVIKDEGLYRLFYRGVREAGKDGNKMEVTCYAESGDGVNWKKPNLGIFEVYGTTDNNVVMADAAPVTHNFSPFLDKNPDCRPDEKYKALGGTKESGLIAFTSPDGIHWKRAGEEAVFTDGLFDSQNVAFWSESEKRYLCYFRTWTKEGFSGFRSVGRTTSVDFIKWTAKEQMTFGDSPSEHLYTQQTSPYYRAPQIYIAIGARFMPNRQVITEEEAKKIDVNPNYFRDCSDAVLLTSRGGNSYDRTFMESFIRPGIGIQNWVSRSNYPALNVVQTSDTEMSLFVNENYAQPTAHIKRYSMRIDGFASICAGYNGGELITKPFTFSGKELEINYSTSAAGEIKIGIMDEKGDPLPGYTLEESQVIIGNDIKRVVKWNGKADLEQLSNKPVRLKFFLRDANLYSFKFKR